MQAEALTRASFLGVDFFVRRQGLRAGREGQARDGEKATQEVTT